MKMIFRNSDSLHEIVGIIKQSTPERTIVWQNKGSKRNVYGVKQIFYDESAHMVKFQLSHYDFSMLVDELIYIKLSFNESLFKGHVVAVEHDIITVYLPEEVKTLELRGAPRTHFMPKDEKKVHMEVAQEITSDKSYHMAFTALDISETGISLIVSDNNKNLIESSGKHVLTDLGSIHLEKSILLDLRYGQAFRYRVRGKTYMSNRFGFKFLYPIDPAILNQFIQR